MKKKLLFIFGCIFLASCNFTSSKLSDVECFKLSKDFTIEGSHISQIFYSSKYDTCFVEMTDNTFNRAIYNLINREYLMNNTTNSDFYNDFLKDLGGSKNDKIIVEFSSNYDFKDKNQS